MIKFLSVEVKSRSAYIFLSLIILIHILILSKLIFFPYPELFVYPYLTNSGLIPYKQILDQHFPGLMFLPINLDNLGMTNAYIARIWQIGLVVITHFVLFRIGQKIFKNNNMALLGSILYLVWQPFLEGWVFWINNFLPILYLLAFYFTQKFVSQKNKDLKLLFLIGVLLGISTLFKQVAIPLAGLTFLWIFYNHRNIKTLIYFSLGYLPIVLMMLLYIFSIGALNDFWFWTVWYNVTTYAQYGGQHATFSQLIRVGAIYLPVILLIFIKERKLAMSLGIFLIGSLSGAIHRFDFVHFQPSLPFVIIGLVLLVDKFWSKSYFKLILIVYLAVTALWLFHFYRGNLRDYIYYFDSNTLETAEVIRSLSTPKEEIFIYGATPLLFQLSETLPAGRVFVFQFPWFMMEAGDKVLEGLVRSQPRIIVADFETQTQDQMLILYTPEIYKYILENYEQDYQIGSNRIFTKKEIYAKAEN